MGTTGQSITLANSIIGVGILAMPFCFQQCGVLLATLILILMGLVSRLCCYFLLKSAVIARRRNFEFLAFHVFGSAGKFAVEVGIIGFLMGTCIAYFVVVGDLGPQIVSKMFNINQSDMLRTSIMVIVSLVCVLPLGLLRNVDSLSNVSAATIGFYICLVLKVIAEAATQLLTKDWQTRVEMWKPSGVLQCVPIFSMALFCQTQLFEIFQSLPGLSMEKMNVVTKNAINICTGVYFTLGLFGYIAFNSQDISGNILMSLSPTMASDVIKLGFVMSLAFSFPLIIFPCRASLYSLLYKKVHSSHHDHIINHSIPETSFRCITVCIVILTLGVSLLLPNIELVLGLVGSTIGVLVCLVFPAACFVSLTFKNTNERVLAKGVVVLGLIIMILGTYANLQAAENQIDKYDDKFITKEKIDKIVEDFFEKREKTDGIAIKSELKSDKAEKSNGDLIKESVVQPPNPVPPESQSNEKNDKHADAVNIPNLKDKLPKPIDIVDKVSESHPKNLNKVIDTKFMNGVNNYKIDEPIKQKEELKPQSIDEKINIMKQQQLIETIKQHGEEQKELIKEQKEILHEIKKTKQELEKNKNDASNDEAKKIAVESIKQIANIALKSLVGVSDKPGSAAEEKKPGEIEKLADEAVHEIAQKAVETIEAIKEINEKPAQPDIKLNDSPNMPALLNTEPLKNTNQGSNLNNAGVINQFVPNTQPQANVDSIPQLPNNAVQNNINVNSQIDTNIKSNGDQVIVPVADVKQTIENAGKPEIIDNANIIKPVIPEPSANVPLPAAVVAPVVNAPNQFVENIPNQQQNLLQSISNDQHDPNIKVEDPSAHLHSPDEPQSYKQGEDSEQKRKNFNDAMAQNMPLALALNGNSQAKQQINTNNGIHNVQSKIEEPKHVILSRRKREVVDCTEKSSLKPEDKEICKTLVDPVEPPRLKLDIVDDVNNLLPEVDISNVNLPNNLPLDFNTLHHISRSLKNVDKKR